MSETSRPPPSARRAFFIALALFDAALLAYLVLTHDWANFEVKSDYPTPAAFLIVGIVWVLLVVEKFFFAAFFLAIGAGIYREFNPPAEPRRVRAVLATLVLLLGLAAIGWLFYSAIKAVTAGPPGFFLDRLTLFDALAKRAHGFGDSWGMTHYVSGSIGAFLVLLIAAGYLAEKYLLAWWGVRWPVAVLPLVAIGWLTWAVIDGEQRQREWVSAQEWVPLETELGWRDAVAACEARGAPWRLPRRQELALYLATQPAAVANWKGEAWTSASAEDGDYAVAMHLAPRKSGFWDRRSQLTRDESPCERRDERAYSLVHDWFSALRPEVCARTTQAPSLYTSGLSPAVLMTGNVHVAQPKQRALCIRPQEPATTPVVRGRGYLKEEEFTRVADFDAAMAQRCAVLPGRGIAACFAFVPAGFDETPDERFMRAFCELDSRQPEGCFRYALLMDRRGDQAERAARYRSLACQKGYRQACGTSEPAIAQGVAKP